MSAHSPGEIRRRKAYRVRKAARDKAEYERRMAPLRAAGKMCGGCDNYRDKICLADSDFYGDTIVAPSYLCPRYRDRPAMSERESAPRVK